jgi:hypothetical protein
VPFDPGGDVRTVARQSQGAAMDGEVNAHERLSAGLNAAMNGRHEEALGHFIWFHDHALQEEPALYGVRLSFALSYWKDLGENYPKALTVLRRKRDEKARALLRGEGGRQLFHDVESINDTLGEQRKTSLLYVRLSRLRPDLARQCSGLALPAVVASENFKLAEQLIREPLERARRLGADLNENIAQQATKPRHHMIVARRALAHNYAQDVAMVLAILNARSRANEARELEKIAVSVLDSPSIRRAVRAFLLEMVA